MKMISKLVKDYQKRRLMSGKTRRYISNNKKYAVYGLLSANPPVFYVSYWMDEDMVFNFSMEKIFKYLRKRNAYFLYAWCWNIDEPYRVQLVRHFEELHKKKYPKHRFIHLCNTISQLETFQKSGLNAIFCNKAAFVDENIFNPLPGITKKYDAIYDARLKDYKRHHLAAKIENLALIYVFSAAVDNPDYIEEEKKKYSNAIFLNHDSESYKKLSGEEINQALNASRVGLCLSSVEGVMYASIQYLLCGIPIVSTKSKGGRDVFYEDDFAMIVDDNAQAVAKGVQTMIELNPAPEMIRSKTIDKMWLHRKRFISIVQNIYEAEGLNRNFASEWNRIFFNKLCRYQKHSDVIKQLKELTIQ